MTAIRAETKLFFHLFIHSKNIHQVLIYGEAEVKRNKMVFTGTQRTKAESHWIWLSVTKSIKMTMKKKNKLDGCGEQGVLVSYCFCNKLLQN